MGKDQRSFPRSVVELAVKIHIDEKWVECQVLDLSVEGISLQVGQSLAAGDSFEVELEGDGWMEKNRVQAVVLRCENDPQGPARNAYNVVVSLIEPNDEYLMGALALVHGPGPKKDRRKTVYGARIDGR